MSKRPKPSYLHAIDFIASNDEPLCLDPDTVATFLSVALISTIWGKPRRIVASDIVDLRREGLTHAH